MVPLRTTPGLMPSDGGTTRPFPPPPARGTLLSMDDQTPAEELPTLYRAVLETVARLERAGERSFAFEIRRKALRTYSTRWDEGGRRVLMRLDRDAQARLDAIPHAVVRATGLATRSESA